MLGSTNDIQSKVFLLMVTFDFPVMPSVSRRNSERLVKALPISGLFKSSKYSSSVYELKSLGITCCGSLVKRFSSI